MKYAGSMRLLVSAIVLGVICYIGHTWSKEGQGYTVVCMPAAVAQQAKTQLAGKWHMSYASGNNICLVKFAGYNKDVSCMPPKLAEQTGWTRYQDRIQSESGTSCFFANASLFQIMQRVTTTAPKVVNTVQEAQAALQ